MTAPGGLLSIVPERKMSAISLLQPVGIGTRAAVPGGMLAVGPACITALFSMLIILYFARLACRNPPSPCFMASRISE